ncbi:MAG: four helix bundle protein, partial [Panacagrimonas sp.]
RYEQLEVWQKAMSLTEIVYRLSAEFPSEERFGLCSQIRRAAVSVPSNIAEGQGRLTTGEFRQFLAHARGSLFETETQLKLACNLEYTDHAPTKNALALSSEIARMLNGLISSLNKRTNG